MKGSTAHSQAGCSGEGYGPSIDATSYTKAKLLVGGYAIPNLPVGISKKGKTEKKEPSKQA